MKLGLKITPNLYFAPNIISDGIWKEKTEMLPLERGKSRTGEKVEMLPLEREKRVGAGEKVEKLPPKRRRRCTTGLAQLPAVAD